MMTCFGRTLALLTLLACLAGCAAMSAPERNPAAGYPFRHADFDFKVAWKITPSGTGIALDGLLKNVRYARVEDIHLTVKLLSSKNKVLAEQSTLFLPLPLEMDDYRPFSVTLANVKPAPGDLLNFSILYRVIDDRRSTFSWLSLFTVDALTGASVGQGGADRDGW
jgi:hypothetical protein